jgi:hypothetical protein
MGANANSLRLKEVDAVTADVVAKVRSLAAKTPYEAPKVVSFPIREMKTSHALSMAGNAG